MNDTKIRMYSTTWCPDCHRAKAFLKSHDVAVEVIDIDTTEGAAEIVMSHNDGRRRVPTFEVDGAFYGNPPLGELADIVGVAA